MGYFSSIQVQEQQLQRKYRSAECTFVSVSSSTSLCKCNIYCWKWKCIVSLESFENWNIHREHWCSLHPVNRRSMHNTLVKCVASIDCVHGIKYAITIMMPLNLVITCNRESQIKLLGFPTLQTQQLCTIHQSIGHQKLNHSIHVLCAYHKSISDRPNVSRTT